MEKTEVEKAVCPGMLLFDTDYTYILIGDSEKPDTWRIMYRSSITKGYWKIASREGKTKVVEFFADNFIFNNSKWPSHGISIHEIADQLKEEEDGTPPF